MMVYNREEVHRIAKSEYFTKSPFPQTFRRDLATLTIVRKMTSRFLKTGIINEKLLLNNIIICLNVFGIQSTNQIFRLTCDDKSYSVIKSCLVFLNSYTQQDSTPTDRVMNDILKDTQHRYHISQSP